MVPSSNRTSAIRIAHFRSVLHIRLQSGHKSPHAIPQRLDHGTTGIVLGFHHVTSDAEQIVDGTVRGEKSLRISRCFKAPYLRLALRDRLIRVFRLIIFPLVLPVHNARLSIRLLTYWRRYHMQCTTIVYDFDTLGDTNSHADRADPRETIGTGSSDAPRNVNISVFFGTSSVEY